GVGFPLVFQMLSSISVNAHDVRTILREKPEFFRPDHKLIRIRKIEHSREAGRHSAIGDYIGQPCLIALREALLILRFPLCIVRRMVSDADVYRSAFARLRGGIKDRWADHLPHTTPVRKFLPRRYGWCV